MTPQPSTNTGSKTWISLNDFGEDSSPPKEVDRYPDMRKLWPEWHAMAECLGVVDDVIFFNAPRSGKYPSSTIKEAQAICDFCPVFTQCLRHALTEREAWGIWASTTIKERKTILDGIDNGHFTMEEIIRDLEEARHERHKG